MPHCLYPTMFFQTSSKMSVNFFLLLLLSSISSVLCTNHDESLLLQMKQQLGNPPILSSWVPGFDFCETAATDGTGAIVYTTCTDTGHLFSLRMKELDFNTSFPDAICGFKELESLEIYHFPGLQGQIPSCITKLLNLRLLVIKETSLSGSVPKFSRNTNLTVITLTSNHLSGKIPPSLANLTNLLSLDLSSNNLTGKIPPGLIAGSSSMLILSNNKLTGEIPASYGPAGLWIFDVSNNLLHGDASFLFGKQKSTVNIGLANNNFKFNLSNIEFPGNLYVLNLSHNKIYGKVPDSFASLGNLMIIDLSFNRLCGQLPQGGNMSQFNAAVFANNTCLCGSPLPPCSNSAPAPAPAAVLAPVPEAVPAPAPATVPAHPLFQNLN